MHSNDTRAATTIRLVCLAAALTLFPAALLAQADSPSRFSTAEVDELDAAQFLQSPLQEFSEGQDMQFIRRAGAADASTGLAPVVLRIFPALEGRIEPPSLATHPPCLVYISFLLPLHFNAKGEFFVNRAPKEWLRAVRNQGMEPGYYTFVFERSGYTDFGTQYFRLFESDRAKYFKRGLSVRINPNGVYPLAEVNEIADAAQRAWLDRQAYARETNLPSLKCHNAKLVATGDADGATTLAWSEGCEAPASVVQ